MTFTEVKCDVFISARVILIRRRSSVHRDAFIGTILGVCWAPWVFEAGKLND